MARYAKLLGALFGALTPAGLVGLLAVFGVQMSPEDAGSLLAAVTTVGSIVGTYIAPANREPEKKVGKHSVEAVAQKAATPAPKETPKKATKAELNFDELTVAPETQKLPLSERKTTMTKDGIIVFE